MIKRHIRHQFGHAQTVHLMHQALCRAVETPPLLVAPKILIAPRLAEYQRVFGKAQRMIRTCTPHDFFVHRSQSELVIVDYGVIKSNWAQRLTYPAAKKICYMMAMPFEIWWVDTFGRELFDPIAGKL